MITLDPHVPVPPGLVEWACGILRSPADRPWRHADKPANTVICPCARDLRMQKYDCEGLIAVVWIGQCGYCEAVVWHYEHLGK